MDDPSIQAVISGAFVIIIALVGWALRTNWQAVRATSDKVSALEVKVAGEYVKKDDYREDVHDIREALRRIEDMMRDKVDK